MDTSKLGRQFYNWHEPSHLLGPEGVTEVDTNLAPPIHPVSGVFSHAYANPRMTEQTVGLPNAFVDRFRGHRGTDRYSVVTSHLPTDLNYYNDYDEMDMAINHADDLDQSNEYGYEGDFRTLPRARVAADAMAKRRIEGRNPRTGR